jgi:DNA-binding transcriptional ArsR family regulator
MAVFLKALADPMRLKILHALRAGEKRGTDLLPVVGGSQPNLSRHLAILRAGGILASRREGTAIWWRIADTGVFRVCDVVCHSLDRALRERERHFMGEA